MIKITNQGINAFIILVSSSFGKKKKKETPPEDSELTREIQIKFDRNGFCKNFGAWKEEEEEEDIQLF